jgi:predicted MPP superfamily phosphohydrolase/glycosyltransferase involved in cell wall biosynthesis
LRIAILTDHVPPKIGGVTTRVRCTVEELRRLGHEVLVVGATRRGAAAEPCRHAVPGVRLPWISDRVFSLWPSGVQGVLAAHRPDVVHVVDPTTLMLPALRYARDMGVPLVFSLHTDYVGYLRYHRARPLSGLLQRALDRLALRADARLCSSPFMQRALAERGVDACVWPGGVDADLFHPDRASAEMRRRLSGGAPDRPLVIYVGRLAREKELDLLRELALRLPGVRLALVGDGPARAALERKFAGTGAVFAGRLSGAELAAAYASADFFVTPSTTETLGLAALEAMAAGAVVIAADAGGLPQVVTDGRTGLLFRPHDARDLLKKLGSLAADPRRLAALRRAAREEVLERWSWRAATEGLGAAYEEAARRPPTREVYPRQAPHRRRRARVALALEPVAAWCLWRSLEWAGAPHAVELTAAALVYANLALLLQRRYEWPDRPAPRLLVHAAFLPQAAWQFASVLAFAPGAALALAWALVAGIAEGSSAARIEGRLGAAVALTTAVSAATAAYAAIGRRRVRTVDLDVACEGLPPAFEGYRIAQLSDFHIGNQTPLRWLESWVERVNAADVDLVALTGDYLTYGTRWLDDVAAVLGRLRARGGVFACLGNHDYFGDAEAVARALGRSGIRVLRNDGVRVRRGGETIFLAGLDDRSSRRDDLARALRLRPAGAPVVLLAHDPASFPEAAAANVALVLSGHTHGGQVALPGRPGWNLSALRYEYSSGLYRRGTSALYVTRGLGTDWLPVRLGAPAEIAVIRLRPAVAEAPSRTAKSYATASGGPADLEVKA